MEALISWVIEARHFWIDYHQELKEASVKIRSNICEPCLSNLTNIAEDEVKRISSINSFDIVKKPK